MVAALRAGAVGYMLKDVDGRELADRINAYVNGDVTIPSALANRLLEHIPAEADRHGLLRRRRAHDQDEDPAARQRRLLAFLRDGVASSEIAAALGTTEYELRAEIVATLAAVRYADRTALAALSSLNA
jgi:DNA-binding NarL/FixJ family response regulator